MTVFSAAIEVRQLSKQFRGVSALAPLDLVVPRGAIFALVGHNGAGKTTLIKLLLNIIKPTSGSATILGESVANIAGSSFEQIAYVSESQEMPEWMTVRAFMDYLRPFYPTWSESDLLAQLDLPPNRKIQHLSRGMRMKAALASVLAFRPQLILMDEPFSGLDPLVRDELIETLLDHMNDAQELGGDQAMTVLLSSHDLGEVESFATHVAFLHQGKLLFAESMTTLTSRFRQVTVTLATSEVPPHILSHIPDAWLLPETGASVFRFVHTRADAGPLEEEVRTLVPGALTIDSESMTLRTIFLAVVKASHAQERGRV